MNTVRRYSDPHNPWWRYEVQMPCEFGPTMSFHFANAQAVADWIEREVPWLEFHWDTRDTEEQRDLDRYEEARSDAREDARLEREEP